MMDKLSIFADENSLDVHNVSADGNCMFSAVVDQLWINGNFIFTPDSLRKEAVESVFYSLCIVLYFFPFFRFTKL